MKNFPDLDSERLEFIGIGMFGLEDMHEYSVIDDFYKFLEFPAHKDKKDTEEYLKKLIRRSERDDAHYWFIRLKENGKIIGTFGLHDIDWRKNIGEVSYGISTKYTRKGFFKESLSRIMDYAFQDLSFHRLCATTRFDNIGSIKGLNKCGFLEEGNLRDYYLNPDGTRYDAVILSILKAEYIKDQK